MNKYYQGSCLCGEIKLEITGNLEQFFLCHCQHCQKDTGSAYAANLFSTTASLHILSGNDNIQTFKLTNSRHSKSFCCRCGSALPHYQMDGKLLVVPAGCLDTPIDIMPNAHIFTNSKANWEQHLNNIPSLGGLPT